MKIYLYGPSGSGKSTVGKKLAGELRLKLIDLDQEIEAHYGKPIRDIFADEGESVFRGYETQLLGKIAGGKDAVVSLGGGALLRDINRKVAEDSGTVICLFASPEVILERIRSEEGTRPLLNGDAAQKLANMLRERTPHYKSFAHQVQTDGKTPEQICWEIQVITGRFTISGMGSAYEVSVGARNLAQTGEWLRDQGMKGPVVVVSDTHIGPLYSDLVAGAIRQSGYDVKTWSLLAGEHSKTIESAMNMWRFFVENKLERGSTVVALGGGVVGDLTGYAASAYLRGVPWINLPTSLLAMVDSSLGGKTAVNLPEGKNLVGAFYAPKSVRTDPDVLQTLPFEELRNGMGEVVKHGVIGDPGLFELCSNGWQKVKENLSEIIRRAIAVKVKVILEDPYEKGIRQTLNYGHTIGHAVESASNYDLKHGEAVSIGMVLEARIAEEIGLASHGLSGKIQTVLEQLDLPVSVPVNLSKEEILNKMTRDKKRVDGKVLFALPAAIGDVRYGVDVDNIESVL